MISLISNTHNFLLTKILTSHNNGTQYSHGHAYPVSLPSQTHLHVHPPEKSAGAHGRPHRRKQHSPIFLQAQINNALSGLDDNESKDLIIRQSLQELAESLVLPPNYLAELPVDLRLDLKAEVLNHQRFFSTYAKSPPSIPRYSLGMLNDAAFDLSSGRLNEECGQKFGQILMQLSQAWEKADTQGAAEIASLFPSLQDSLTENVEAAIGKRLIRAGRRFASMGQYGQGELQKIAKSMIAAGEALARNSSSAVEQQQPMEETRILKFGTLQVELTSKKAYIGSIFALAFGILSWQLSAAVQSTPEDSLQYANGNALLLAKSLRGALLALCYSSTILSGSIMVGLILYGRQLSSKGK